MKFEDFKYYADIYGPFIEKWPSEYIKIANDLVYEDHNARNYINKEIEISQWFSNYYELQMHSEVENSIMSACKLPQFQHSTFQDNTYNQVFLYAASFVILICGFIVGHYAPFTVYEYSANMHIVYNIYTLTWSLL